MGILWIFTPHVGNCFVLPKYGKGESTTLNRQQQLLWTPFTLWYNEKIMTTLCKQPAIKGPNYTPKWSKQNNYYVCCLVLGIQLKLIVDSPLDWGLERLEWGDGTSSQVTQPSNMHNWKIIAYFFHFKHNVQLRSQVDALIMSCHKPVSRCHVGPMSRDGGLCLLLPPSFVISSSCLKLCDILNGCVCTKYNK